MDTIGDIPKHEETPGRASKRFIVTLISRYVLLAFQIPGST